MARYQAVETHPQWRRHGLAATLVYEASLWADRHGARSLVVVAARGGPAAGVYRSLGFSERERQVSLLRPAES